MSDQLREASSTAETAKGEASNVASTAAESGGRVADAAKGGGQQVLSEARSQARNLADETRSQIRNQAGDQQQRAAAGLRKLRDEFSSMTENGEQSGLGSQLVRQASDQVGQVADWLESRDPQGLLSDVRGFARRRPGAFLLGAAVAGIVAGRMTRAGVDATREQQQSGSSGTAREYRSATATADVADPTSVGFRSGAGSGTPPSPVTGPGGLGDTDAGSPADSYSGQPRGAGGFVDPGGPR